MGAELPDAVILFGASGFIGRNILQALVGRIGLIIGISASGNLVSGCDKVITPAGLATLPPLPARTSIIHVAAMRYAASNFATQQSAILSTNLHLTDLVYQFAMARGITEIRAASSAAVYPASWTLQDDAEPLDLNSWPHPGEAAYAWSKRWGEIVAKLWYERAGVNTITLRLTNPYGPFDTQDESEAHVATAFVIRALGVASAFTLRGDPEAERDFVFAGDVAAAFVASLRMRGVHDVVNCAAGQTTKVIDLAIAAMRASGRERPVEVIAAPPGANPGVKIRHATATRLRRVLPGLGPFHSLADGMNKKISWYRDALR